MNPTPIPGNEPDPGDMSTKPGTMTPDVPVDRGLPDADADLPDDFA